MPQIELIIDGVEYTPGEGRISAEAAKAVLQHMQAGVEPQLKTEWETMRALIANRTDEAYVGAG